MAETAKGSLETFNEIQDALEELKLKNLELRQNISYLRKENLGYKQRYQGLKGQLNSLVELLEKNTSACNDLFNDFKHALQLGQLSILNSPEVQKKKSRINGLQSETLMVTSSPVRSLQHNFENLGESLEQCDISLVSSITSINSRKPPQTQNRQVVQPEINNSDHGSENEADESLINEENLDGDVDATFHDRLTTIIEESSTPEKKLKVSLARLPAELVYQHLRKSNLNDSSNASLSNANLSHKSDVAERLTDNISNFVTVRNRIPNKCSVCPKQEKKSLESLKTEDASYRSGDSDTSPLYVNKRRNPKRLKSSPKEFLKSPKKEAMSPSFKVRTSSRTPSKKRPSSPEPSSSSKRPARNACPVTLKVKTSSLTPNKKRPSSPEPSSSSKRPARKARPISLKEEPLNTKKRRP